MVINFSTSLTYSLRDVVTLSVFQSVL